MNKIFVGAILSVISSGAFADHSVNGYFRSNGEYVQPHMQTDSNNTVMDNYSHKGNVNPYTGQQGTHYDRSSPSSNYYGTTPSYGNTPGRQPAYGYPDQ